MIAIENYVRPTTKPSSYEHYRDNCEKHIIPELGKLPLNEITSRRLQQFFNQQAKEGNKRTGGALSTKSMRNMRVVLDGVKEFSHLIIFPNKRTLQIR